MRVDIGRRLGPYEIVSPLGAGGMGEVYRARDTRLDRSVAVKVLAPAVAQDAERRSRFEREAKAIAALTHPHICTLYDVGQHGDTAYLVMELVDGQTLAARLEKGALPLAEALTIASQVADALASAHRLGIVHRDIKPANIMLTKSGVKLLDFGLAKLRPTTGAVAFRASPQTGTATATGTAEGTILGTIHYMAPEQVEGKDADHRADIWAFGAVLYEMVTGVRPFTGDTAASVVGAILKDTPVPSSVRQPLAPASLDELVDGCLAKDPDERWQSVSDVRRQLRSGMLLPGAAVGVVLPLSAGRAWTRWAVAAAVALVAAITWLGLRSRPSSEAPPAPGSVVRFQLTLPPGLTLVPEQPPAMSPDGTRLALVAIERESGLRQIYIRPLGSVTAQAVGGTAGAQYPFWSPDGTKLAYFGGTRLRTVDLQTGVSQDVAPAPNPGGPGIWAGRDILFPRTTGPIVSVADTGGSPRNVVLSDALQDVVHSLAGVLPDGRLFVSSQAGLFIIGRDGQAALLSDAITMPATLLDTPTVRGSRRFIIVFTMNGRLMAQGLDASGDALEGQPVELAGEASRLVAGTARPFSAGADVFAFTTRSDVQTRPTWVSRAGVALGPAASIRGQLRDVRLSPDGRTLSLSHLSDQGRFELLLVDLLRDTVSRLASELSVQLASWAADGQSLLAVGQLGSGARGFYRVAAREGAAPELVAQVTGGNPANAQLTADGRYFAYSRSDETGNFDIYFKALDESGNGRALVAGASYEAGVRFSPDERLIAYHSNEDGRLNVFVRSFPDGGGKQQLSFEGGQRPQWRPDGKELYYLAADGGLMAAPVISGPTLTIGKPERLFTAPVDATFGTPGATLFAPTADGQRFVMLVPTSNVPQPVTVIVNWQALLQP